MITKIQAFHDFTLKQRRFLFKKYQEYFKNSDGYTKGNPGNISFSFIFNEGNNENEKVAPVVLELSGEENHSENDTFLANKKYISYSYDGYLHSKSFKDIPEIYIGGLFEDKLSMTGSIFETMIDILKIDDNNGDKIKNFCEYLKNKINLLEEYDIEGAYKMHMDLSSMFDKTKNIKVFNIYQEILYSMLYKLDYSLFNYKFSNNSDVFKTHPMTIIQRKNSIINLYMKAIDDYFHNDKIRKIFESLINKFKTIIDNNLFFENNNISYFYEIYSYEFGPHRLHEYNSDDKKNLLKDIKKSFKENWSFEYEKDFD